jgi:hypothetical protein
MSSTIGDDLKGQWRNEKFEQWAFLDVLVQKSFASTQYMGNETIIGRYTMSLDRGTMLM